MRIIDNQDDIQGRVISLDPGVHTFMTSYDHNGQLIELGKKANSLNPTKRNKKLSQNHDFSTVTDPRFEHVRKDPRFIRPKRKDVKITLDPRFANLFNSEEFIETPKVDKYGRSTSSDKVASELRNFYMLDEEDSLPHENKIHKLSKDVIDSSDDDSEKSEYESEEDTSPVLDLARGEVGTEQPDEQIPIGEETHRFAVVNLDWDNEAHEGPPKEIFIPADNNSEDEEINEKTIIKCDFGEEFDQDALRKYQLERLKYYYAVVDCDTVENSRHIYQQCDGTEFESTANVLDLRFIPDDMTFEDEAKDECFQAPDIYKPVDFVTGVLQHSDVKLTWDEDDPDRVKVVRRSFSKKDIEEMDFKVYLASSSEESDESDETSLQKYKNLVNEANNEYSDDDLDMEITFTPGLNEQATETSMDKSIENETTIEIYKRKQREKRKERKAAKKANKSQNIKNEMSDDSTTNALDDPFFENSRKRKQKISNEERIEADRKRAELELLVMDEEDNKHFDMKEIIKNEKKKRKRKNQKDVQEDTFEINVNDSRFAALHESHHFAIDPANPRFKKTKAMSKLLEEQRRQASSKEKLDISDDN
ncbi:19598_t:CDS:10 [Gigaspora margarita]|uniref:19598_t:CDS:1 n=1 Tax=Gigaspora margarita TaxID=4874 RepID=A0ABM8VXY7_GIGMA|nr:19598_t:CDS:10 [Gigaspora margarita]